MSTLACSTLVAHCVECAGALASQKGVTVSTHVDEYIAAVPALASDEVAATTLRECIYGVVRCKAMLTITADGLYARHAAAVARSDRALYELFTWIAVFGLKQMGLSEFRQFVLSQEAHKMHTLLSFLWDPETQDGWLAEQWSAVYDHIHVREVLLGTMREFAPQMNALISELAAKLTHTSSSGDASAAAGEVGMSGVTRVARKESTVPAPFALTQPKVKMLPAPPLVMTATYKATPIPAAIYANSLQQIEADAAQRRRDTEQAVAKRFAGVKPPVLATHARGQTTHVASEKLRLELEEADRVARKGITPRAAPVVKPVAPAKATTAVILREDLLYKRRLEEQAAAAAKFESELRDADDFHAWQLKMESLDDAARAEEIAARKLANAQAADEAVLALQAHAYEKHKQVLAFREELAQINAEKEREAAKLVEANQQKVAQVAQGKLAIAPALAEVAKKKVEKAEEIAAAKEVAAAERKAAAARDLAAKKALIKQIQAMESLANARAKRAKEIDPTSTSGIGLLDEMSLVELQTRLRLMNEREEIYLREKRQRILEDKSRKAEVLQKMQRQAARMRGEMRSEASEAKLSKTQALETAAQAVAAKAAADAIVLQRNLAETQEIRRKEALRLVAELKAKKIQNAFYAQSKSALAAGREEDLARARARVEAEASLRKVDEDKQAQIVRYEAEKNRVRLEKQKLREKQAVRIAAQKTLEAHRVDGAQMASEDAHVKALQHREIRSAVNQQVDAHRSRNPYAKSIAEREAKRAARLAKTASSAANRSSDAQALLSDSEEAQAELEAERRAEKEMEQQVAALGFGAADDDEEEEKQQSPPPVAAQQEPAPTTTTLKRSAAKTRSAAAKPVPLAAH